MTLTLNDLRDKFYKQIISSSCDYLDDYNFSSHDELIEFIITCDYDELVEFTSPE